MTNEQSLKKFMKEISIELDNFERDAEDVIKKAILIAHGTVTALSPVDSGRYKASHFISRGKESQDVAEEGKADYSSDINDRNKEAQSTKPKLENISWFVTNNLEYSEALEGGHSDLAPNGIYSPAKIIAENAIKVITSRLNNIRIK